MTYGGGDVSGARGTVMSQDPIAQDVPSLNSTVHLPFDCGSVSVTVN